MNENKRINDRWIKIVKCVGAKAQDEKMRWNTTKTNNGRSFQYTKFSVIDLVLTDKRNISDTRAKSACGKFSSYRFSFSAISNTRNKTIFFTCVSAAFLRKSLYNAVVNMIISIINSVYKTKLSYFIPLPPAQHHSFCKNLLHYSIRYKIESRPRPRSRQRYFPLLGLVWFWCNVSIAMDYSSSL